MHPCVLSAPENFAQFAEAAIARGIGEICVTDHMPLSLSHAKDRLQPGTVREYCARVHALAAAYAGRLGIKCGIEIDYHPSVLPEIYEVLGQGDFDCVLASTHLHIFEKERLARYTYNDFAALALENTQRAAESDLFDIIAHPDMYRFAFSRPDRFPLRPDAYTPERHESAVKALLRAVAARGMRLEINPHLAEHFGDLAQTYPQESILAWALELGVRFSYGSDAHKAESVGALLDELERHPLYGRALTDWGNEA